MIPNNRAFDGKNNFQHDGITYYRWHYLHRRDKYSMRFRLVSTDSPHKQAIALFFADFKGALFLDRKPMKILKGIRHYIFDEDHLRAGFEISVNCEEGFLFFGNASQTDVGTYHSGAFGCAFWIEVLSDNHYRFHCNDHEYDDDFNDLVFDMVINEGQR